MAKKDKDKSLSPIKAVKKSLSPLKTESHAALSKYIFFVSEPNWIVNTSK